MYCGKCGAKVPDGYEYCMKCGAKLEASANDTESADAGAKQGGKKKIIIPVAIVLALVCVGVAGFFFFNRGKNTADNGLFHGIAWGTDIETAHAQIKKLYPMGEDSGEEDGTIKGIVIEDYEGMHDVQGILAAECESDTDRTVNKFYEIITAGKESDYAEDNALFVEYAARLSEEYGEYDSNSYNAILTWTTEESNIILMNVHENSIMITYMPVE